MSTIYIDLRLDIVVDSKHRSTAYTEVVMESSITSLRERIKSVTISPYTYAITNKSTITSQNSHLISYFDTVSWVFWLVEMLRIDPFSFDNSRWREPIRCPGGTLPNIPLTLNHLHLRQCIHSDLFVLSLIDLHPPSPNSSTLYLRPPNCHAFISIFA
jgi:hypothetical protein